MARCYCRWSKVLICVCTPCILLALLFVYITIMVCMNMTSTATPGFTGQAQKTAHFVALGTYSNKSFAPYPKTFWKLLLHEDGFWNQLQLSIDRSFNPILRRNIKKESENSMSSLLRQSFSEVSDFDSTRRMFHKLPQQMQEYISHMQKRDYPILIQPDGVCGAGATGEKEPPLLLLAIKTTELNFMNRQAIRQTWGQVGWIAGQKRNNSRGQENGGYIRRVFLLGKEESKDLDVHLSEKLRMESARYGDILQWDFRDTFFNLTLKDVLFWNWFSCFCNLTRFIFKGDDDVFVNTLNMITFLQDQLEMPQSHKTLKDFMVGDVIGAAVPSRVNISKYFIPDSFYKGLYPVYAGGGGVLYSGLLATRLHNISKRVHLFPIDDVYVGMCMLRLNAHPIHNPAFLTFDFPKEEMRNKCLYNRILLVHKRSPYQIVRIWNKLKRTQAQCWDVPLREPITKENKSKLQRPSL